MCSRPWRATTRACAGARSRSTAGRTTPGAALDRITIPQEVLDRIAPTALPRSSIVVSDEPLSRETNYRTEFVAVLSNQPQGGFITRRPTPAVDVADSSTWGGERFGFFFQPGWNFQPQTSNTRQRGGQPYYPAQRGYYPAQQGYPVQQGYPMQPGRW